MTGRRRRWVSDLSGLTPIEKHGALWLKREDLFRLGKTAKGSKCRATAKIALGAPGVVGTGSRLSGQITRVAQVAAELGMPCRVHCGIGPETAETLACKAAGAEVLRHKPARIVVAAARARADAEERGWAFVPFGAEHPITVDETRKQCRQLPKGVKRVVVPVGSAMTLCGLLWGLPEALPILGVQIEADPTRRLDKFAPENWRERVEIVQSEHPFSARIPGQVGDVELDSMYESKAALYLQPGDLLWVCGKGHG